MSKRLWGAAIAATIAAATVVAACAADGPPATIPLPADGTAGSFKSEPVSIFEAKDKKSGYLFANRETQAMESDDGENPAMLWVEQGEALYLKKDGEAGKSCASCHAAAANLRGVGNTYPKVSKDTGKLFTIEDQINYCRTERMKAQPLKMETPDMLALSTLVMYQSRGLPMSVATDGPARTYFEEGDRLYHTRRGQLNVACTQCHDQNAGNMLRADLLSEGRSNGFPLYRLKNQRVGSFDARMEECYGQVRAQPEPYGSDELKKLQLYVAWRSNGLPVETPAVRR
jgi:sulfur-oxidizing protein SoxA